MLGFFAYQIVDSSFVVDEDDDDEEEKKKKLQPKCPGCGHRNYCTCDDDDDDDI